MDKRRPAYDLEAFKGAVATDRVPFTRTAVRDAQAIGFGYDDMKAALERVERQHFVKSMTSRVDHRVWQDVYNVSFEGIVLYVKFTADAVGEFTLLSFKEK